MRLVQEITGDRDAHAVEVRPPRRLVQLDYEGRPVGKMDTATGVVYTLAGKPSHPFTPRGKPSHAHLERIRAARVHPQFPRAVHT